MQVCVQLILLCLGLMAIFASAQQGTAEETRAFKHPLTDMPGAADDIETTPYFPTHADHKLPIGEVVTTLCHLTNTGSRTTTSPPSWAVSTLPSISTTISKTTLTSLLVWWSRVEKRFL